MHMSSTSCSRYAGGKGNKGMFIERDPKVCAAGMPSAQATQTVKDLFQQSCLQDEVDALIHDSILPPPKLLVLPPLRNQPKLDMRYAGPFSEAAQLINPLTKTKYQTLVEDFKNTTYTSYWNKVVGSAPDPVPFLPIGFDTMKTTFGKKTPDLGRLYDVVMPKIPVPDKTLAAKSLGYQTDRNYCRPAYNPDTVFGLKTPADKRGRYMKCCLTDDRLTLGATNSIVTARQADDANDNKARLGVPLAPCNNISNVPPGYSFGILKPPDNMPECLTNCEINPEREHFLKCLSHLNTVRKCLKKRFEGSFFSGLYLNLKYFDKTKTGWLPKDVIYNYCRRKFIRFDPLLIEPILATWNAFDGSQIEYKTFVTMINHRYPSPELPDVWDVPKECIDFRTTYTEMVKPSQKVDDRLMAGIPSGRYFDLDYPVTPAGCCKAHRICLCHESDAKSCLNPSVLTNLVVSHRDMFAVRTPKEIRRLFESAAKEKFTDTEFENVLEVAKNYHSQGMVSFETFRKALNKVNEDKRKIVHK